MGTLLPWQQKQVLIALLFITFFHIWCTHSLRQQQSLVLPIAMNTLLFWQQKQVLITLLFEGIQILYLVQMFFEVFVISFIFVAMDTMLPRQKKQCTCNICNITLSLVHIHFEATAVPGIICC